jgi:hypothetical protein
VTMNFIAIITQLKISSFEKNLEQAWHHRWPSNFHLV